MTSPENQPTDRTAFWWILIVCVVAHGLLPLSTVVISDDWFTLLSYKTASFAAAWRGAVFLSMPLTVIQTVPFFLVGDNMFLLRGFNFLVILGLGQMLFLLLSRLRPAARQDAVWISLFTVAFPGYLVHFMVSFLFYPLGLLLFVSALWIVLVAEDEPRTDYRRVLFAAAACMVFYSFHFGALLVFYTIFIVAHVQYRLRRLNLGLLGEFKAYLTGRYLFLLLPFWFWGLRLVFGIIMTTSTEYNQPSLSWPKIMAGLLGFVASYRAIFAGLFASAWFFASVVVLLAIAMLRRKDPVPIRASWRDHCAVAIALLALFCGILPFVMVGKSPLLGPIDPKSLSAFDMANQQVLVVIDARMHLFLGLAAGIILVSLGRIVAAAVHWRTGLYNALLGAALTSCVISTINNYIHVEGSAITMAGVRERLREHPELRQAGVIGVVDRIDNISTTWDSWALFLETVWGDRKHSGVPEKWYGRQANAQLCYNPETVINKLLYGGAWYQFLTKPDASATQSTVIVSHGPGYYAYADWKAVLLYQFYRLLEPQRLSEYVKEFACITIVPKIDLSRGIAQGSIGSGWPELARVTNEVSGPAYLQVNDGKMGDGANRGAEVYKCLTRTEGGGQYVLLDVEQPSNVRDLSHIAVSDSSGKLLPTLTVQRREGIAVLGLLETQTIEVRLKYFDGIEWLEPHWRIHRARQQPLNQAGGFCLLPQPYLNPQSVDPVSYSGVMDLDEQVMPELLWADGPKAHRLLVSKTNGGLFFNPERVGQTMSSDSINVRADRQTYVRIDWGDVKALQNPAVIQAIAANGHRLLDFVPPSTGGIRIYVVPPENDTERVWLRVSNREARPAILPRRITMIVAEGVSALTVPIENLFAFTNPVAAIDQ